MNETVEKKGNARTCQWAWQTHLNRVNRLDLPQKRAVPGYHNCQRLPLAERQERPARRLRDSPFQVAVTSLDRSRAKTVFRFSRALSTITRAD